jgi:hypothetical protein
MRRYVCCAFLAGALCVAHTSAGAEPHEQNRTGFWLGVGGGYGSANASMDDAAGTGRGGGFTGHVRFGGKLGERTLLGCELRGVTSSETDTTVTVGDVSAAVYFYPAPHSGLFVKGGVGLSVTRIHITPTDRDETARGTGPGLTMGVGYDYRIGRNVSLTPMATLYMGWPGNLKRKSGETALTGAKFNILDVGLGLTFH